MDRRIRIGYVSRVYKRYREVRLRKDRVYKAGDG